MAGLSGTRGRCGWGLLVLAVVFLAGCGSAGRGGEYSVRQVTAAFALQGIRLHENKDISTRGVSWLSSPGRDAYHDPAVTAVVLTKPSAGQFSFQQSRGNHARLRRVGDVRVVWTAGGLDTRVHAALTTLGQDKAPQQPKPKPASGRELTSLAQTLAKIPQPLRTAVRKTAAAPSAHVTITGKDVSGSGDYSTAKQIGALHMKAFCVNSNEVIDGTTLYTSSSFPARANRTTPTKWVKQDLQDLPATASNGRPRAQLLTFAPGLAMLSQAGRVSNLGRQTIDGIETTHYRARLDFPTGLPPIDRHQPGNMGGIDVRVDKGDGYIRRARLNFVGPGETVNLSRFGEHVHVTVPPAGRTVDPRRTRGHLHLTVKIGVGATGCGKP